MTTLRDDGYLETDDPVVAACFLGRTIHLPSGAQVVTAVNARRVATPTCAVEYPVLVPASAVSQVWNSPQNAFVRMVVAWSHPADFDGCDLGRWLGAHTGGHA